MFPCGPGICHFFSWSQRSFASYFPWPRYTRKTCRFSNVQNAEASVLIRERIHYIQVGCSILRGYRGYSSALKGGLQTKSPQISSWSLEKHIHRGEMSTVYCETRNKATLGHSYSQLVWLRVFNDPMLGSHALLCRWRQSLDHSEEAAAGCCPVCDPCLVSVNSWFSRDWERLHRRHLSIDAYTTVDANFASECPWVSTGATVFMQCLELNLCWMSTLLPSYPFRLI